MADKSRACVFGEGVCIWRGAGGVDELLELFSAAAAAAEEEEEGEE